MACERYPLTAGEWESDSRPLPLAATAFAAAAAALATAAAPATLLHHALQLRVGLLIVHHSLREVRATPSRLFVSVGALVCYWPFK